MKSPDPPHNPDHGTASPMAPHPRADRKKEIAERRSLLWLPLGIGLAMALASLVAWHYQSDFRSKAISDDIEAAADIVKEQFLAAVTERARAMTRMAKRLEGGHHPEFDFALDLQDYPSLGGVAWLDKAKVVRKILSTAGEFASGVFPSLEEIQAAVLDRTRGMNGTSTTFFVQPTHNGRGILLCSPVYRDGSFAGAAVGVFRISTLLDRVLTNIAPEYEIAIRSNGEEIYYRGQEDSPRPDSMTYKTKVSIGGVDYSLTVWPQAHVLRQKHTRLPEVVLLAGLLVSALLTAVLYLTQSSLRHSRFLQEAHRRLQSEVYERERADEALRGSERLLRTVTDSIASAVWIVRDAGVIYANPAFESLTGYTAKELSNREFWELIHPEFLLVKERELMRQNEIPVVSEYEVAILDKQGEQRWLQISAGLTEVNGRHAVLYTGHNITDRKRAEEALAESEARYRELVENAAYGIYRCNSHGVILDANPALASILGYEDIEELLTRNLFTDVFRNPEDLTGILDRCGREGRVDGTVVEWNRKDGITILVRLGVRLMNSMRDAVHTYDVFAEDVTRQRLLEEQVRQSQKMEAVGQLAGGVAHDFNNILTVILGYGEMLYGEFAPEDPMRESTEEIIRAANHAASLTRQLLAFSRRQVLHPATLDLNATVAELNLLLRRLIGEDIELKMVLDPSPLLVRADLGQIEQVIMNLAVNARDAMPDGGRLTIETAKVQLSERFAGQQEPLKPGSYVMLAVGDDGAGIDAEVLPHIFEPFFTTKGSGAGTGLGLATVHGIVNQSGGFIRVFSTPGSGTVFRIYLPSTEESVRDRDMPVVTPASFRGKETILVVEDEKTLGALTCRILEASGYQVLFAKNGFEAIEIAGSHQGLIHLLLTDVVMPGIGGDEVAKRIQSLLGRIRTLFVSGYTDEFIARHGVLEPGRHLLQKPYTRYSLLNKVREVLDSEVP